MTALLELTEELKDRLWSHLLQNTVEQVAFVFATVEENDGAVVFTARDVYLANRDDFEIQTEFHVELSAEVQARIIKRAWDTGTTPIEFHSHPNDPWQAVFSPSDLSGFAEYVPHCRWRLRGRPYLAVLVNPTSIDALAWIDTTGQPTRLAAIRVAGGDVLSPTNRTFDHLNRKEY